MDFRTFFTELKRRRVFRVAAVYAVVSFILVQVADLLVPALILPDWAFRFVVFLLILGFPVALVLAWAFDVTPEGVVRADPLGERGDGDTGPDRGEAEVGPGGEGGAAGEQVPGESVAGAREGLGRPGAAVVGGGAALGIVLLALVLFVPGRQGPLEPTAPEAGELSVAVLPFVNLSPDPDQAHFSDGIAADLIGHLARIDGLRVISWTSAMRFRESGLALGEIARELGVRYVVEGNARWEANDVLINVQLVDAARDSPLWHERYLREITGLFQVQGAIAQEIAGALERSLAPGDLARIAGGETGSMEAYGLFQRGREYLHRPGALDLERYELSRTFFRRSVEADPGFARAWAGLAEGFRRDIGLNPASRGDSAAFYAERARELDPGLAEARTELGFGHLLRHGLDRASAEFRAALEINPSQADAMTGLARIHMVQGRLDQAIRWQRNAVEVAPFSPDPLTALGQLLFHVGDLEGARDPLERAAELRPDDGVAQYLLASVYRIQGDPDRARARMDALLAAAAGDLGSRVAMGRFLADMGLPEESDRYFDGPAPVGAVVIWKGSVAKMLGRDEEVREVLEWWSRNRELVLGAGEAPPPRADLSVRALAGDRDAVLAILREHWPTALESVESPPLIGVYYIDHDPLLEEFTSDPEFQALMAEIRAGLDSIRALADEP